VDFSVLFMCFSWLLFCGSFFSEVRPLHIRGVLGLSLVAGSLWSLPQFVFFLTSQYLPPSPPLRFGGLQTKRKRSPPENPPSPQQLFLTSPVFRRLF